MHDLKGESEWKLETELWSGRLQMAVLRTRSISECFRGWSFSEVILPRHRYLGTLGSVVLWIRVNVTEWISTSD